MDSEKLINLLDMKKKLVNWLFIKLFGIVIMENKFF